MGKPSLLSVFYASGNKRGLYVTTQEAARQAGKQSTKAGLTPWWMRKQPIEIFAHLGK